MTALVGPSGSGKSTIANLLARLWDVKSGNVTIRGVDIRNVPLSELMDQISMVFQRVYLFQDTIYNNIIMGKPDATEEEVYEAARKARCYDFIMALPDGFQTVVGEGGATLSGGEKQRISIARCILKDAPIVILDEATRTSPKGREVHLFSGFLKCADCGRAITRCVGKNNNVYYSCSTYKNRSRTACTMHSIKHERLEAAVLFAVQHQVHLAVSYSEIVTQINSAPIKKSQSYRLDDLIAAKERELTKITRYKQSLYQDWKDGEITQQEYRDMKADYERQTSDISAVLTRLNAERAELANGVDNEHPALVAFMKYQNIETLNREILVELVDYIKVYENGNISVKFKFADELRKIAEYIEINTTEDTAVAG